MRTNAAGIALIKRFEGLRLEAYQDTVDKWSIGYGHTRDVKPGDVITHDDAEEFLIDDLRSAEQAVTNAVTVPLNSNQFSACVSLAFNVGGGAFARSTLCKKLNAGDYDGAAREFDKWNKAGGKVIPGLAKRRNAEEELFLREPPKSLSKSRTMAAQTVAGSSAMTSGVIESISDAQNQLGDLALYLDIAKYALIGLAVLSIGYTMYARWDDSRKGVR